MQEKIVLKKISKSLTYIWYSFFIKKNPRKSRVFKSKDRNLIDYCAAAIEVIAASTPSIESAAFLIRASASTSTSSAVA